MTVELRPFGTKCNIQCQYCYQNPPRDAGNIPHTYDLEKMKRTLDAEGGDFTLFGGEPLLMPIADLQTVWGWGLEKSGKNAIQTNGVLISDEHIELFRRFKVGVGISVDGPGELNDVRWAGTLDKTRAATSKTLSAIDRLCDAGMPPSLIVTLHQGNATAERLPLLEAWFRDLDRRGINSARLHALETESEEIRTTYALTTEQNLHAFITMARLETELSKLRFDVFTDIRRLLRGQDESVTCVWGACDPYTTRAVHGVEGNGQRSNCGRTYKDGIEFAKASSEGFERYLALYQTPQRAGGCRGCRFFLMCKGECPGTAIDGDWRNRTADCSVWMGLFEHLETELLRVNEVPLSLHPRRQEVETAVIAAWSGGQNRSAADVLRHMNGASAHATGDCGCYHVDHTDAS